MKYVRVMRDMRILLGAFVMTAAGCAGGPPAQNPEDVARQVTTLADAYVRDYLEAFPYQALAIGAPEVHPDRLVDHGLPALAKWQAREDALLADVRKIDTAAIGGRPEAVTHTFLQYILEAARDFRQCRMELWNVSPTWTGWQGDLPIVAGMQKNDTPADQQAALARWSELPKYLDDEIANLREGLKQGQIHDTGLAQMETIQAEMRAIGKRSFGVEDPQKLIALVKTDPKYRFKSREELIKYAESAVERAKQAVPKFFMRLPKAPVIVEPYPPFLEKTAPGGQAVSPSADGKPGKYMINAYKATEQSKAGLESTAFHEAYPGHHLQVATALERTGLHNIQRYFFLSGFGEGWALYTERLSDEMGLFTSDVDRLGLLSNEALRAARLVVDSGMHMLGWPRQKAIDYVLAHTTETPGHAAAEIDRYIAVPGQATAYMIGNLEIRRLRTEGEQALGAKFDLRAFHDLVLEDGALPLSALRTKVERWITTRRQ